MPGEYDTDSAASSRTKPVGERAREKASEVAREAKQRGKQRAEQGKDAASDRIQQFAGAVEDVAARLGEQDETLAGFANALAQRATRLAESLRGQSIEDLARQAQDLARRNPGLFFAGSVVAGIVLARLLKVSAQHSQGPQRLMADEQSIDESPGIGQYTGAGEGAASRSTGY